MEGAGENSQNQAATVTAPASGGHAEVIQTEEKNPRKLLARELSSMDPENIVILQTGVLHPESVVRYLTVFVISAEGIPESDKKNPSYTVEVALGEKKQETNPSKDLTWNEVFRFPVPWETTENFLTTRSRDKVRFTLKEKTHVFTRIVGTLDKDLEDLLPEVMTELSEGIFYTDKKGRPASDTPSQTAKISFRMVLESLPLEDRHLAAKPLTLPKDLVVVYPTIDGIAFKPGDVLLYNMPGPVASLIKAKYGIIWSHCGLVVELPNKWTGEHQLYVLEYTRNVEGFFDRYSEEFLRCGPMLYRLEERIYGAPGTEIWLMPLKDSIVKPDSNAKLASWVTDLRSTCNKHQHTNFHNIHIINFFAYYF